MENVLTVKQTIDILNKLVEEDSSRNDLPVMLVENIFQRGTCYPTIRHIRESDIKIEKDLKLCSEVVYSQCDKGLILGFVTIVED